jgi:hypothetical protein
MTGASMKGMAFVESDGTWLLPGVTPSRCEVRVAGSRNAPDPERLALLDRVLPQLEELHARAATWLDGFVDRNRFAAQGHGWELAGVSSAPRDAAGTNQLTLHFVLEGDPYGEWAVTLQESGAHLFLAALTRRQT